MIGNRVGVLASLVAALSLLVSSAQQAQAPSPQAQVPPASSQETPQNTSHSIKITLGDTDKGCRVQSVSPEAIGVYPGDWLIWNVENACSAEATLRIEPKDASKVLAVKGETFSRDIPSVPTKGRAHVMMQVEKPKNAPGWNEGNPWCVPIACKLKELPQEICDKLNLCTCREPPCPPKP